MKLLLLVLLLLGARRLADCQDFEEGNEEGQGDDMSNLMDPNVVLSGEGGAGLLGSDGLPDGARTASPMETLRIQTLAALQELGVVVGVAFMVGMVFCLMVSAEKLLSRLRGRCFGSKEVVEEDPAALVGTFKRCKNI